MALRSRLDPGRHATGWRLPVVAAAFFAALSLASPVAARESVDPTTLNPPPPPEFNPVCERTGDHIVCSVEFLDPPVVAVGSGLVCDGVELLQSAQRSVTGKRYYSASGDLLERHFHEAEAGTFWNPLTGRAVTYTEHGMILHRLATPGDPGSGTEAFSGQFRVSLDGARTLLIDVGHSVVDRASDDLLHLSGQHPLSDYFEGGDDSVILDVCAAVS